MISQSTQEYPARAIDVAIQPDTIRADDLAPASKVGMDNHRVQRFRQPSLVQCRSYRLTVSTTAASNTDTASQDFSSFQMAPVIRP